MWYYPAERIGVRAGRGWDLEALPADGVTVSSVPDGMFIPPAYLFDGTAYYPADSLSVGIEYWIFFRGEAVLIME